jgi:hypothetical protein
MPEGVTKHTETEIYGKVGNSHEYENRWGLTGRMPFIVYISDNLKEIQYKILKFRTKYLKSTI